MIGLVAFGVAFGVASAAIGLVIAIDVYTAQRRNQTLKEISDTVDGINEICDRILSK